MAVESSAGFAKDMGLPFMLFGLRRMPLPSGAHNGPSSEAVPELSEKSFHISGKAPFHYSQTALRCYSLRWWEPKT